MTQDIIELQRRPGGPYKPMITVITDASWCHNTHVGGWAAWCVCDGQRVLNSGILKTQIASSEEAEICALVNGLHTALQAFRPASATRVLLQSDSLGALGKLKQPDRAKTAIAKKALIHYDQLLSVQYPDLVIETRHVKGHSRSSKGARFYVNNWADEEAGKQMRIARLGMPRF